MNMIMQIHILGKIRNPMKFTLFISFIISPPCKQTDNDLIPTPVVVTPQTANTSPNQRRLYCN
jgi:hypothetical protein